MDYFISLRYVGVFLTVYLILFLSLCTCATGSDYLEGYNDGVSSGNILSGEFGSKEKVKNRLFEPMTSDNTLMKACGSDGETFDAQLTSSSSKNFLEVFAVPGSLGGLSPVIVKIDENLDSNYDTVFTCPVSIEGICSNGFISCTPGTWNNCKYYKWVYNPGSGMEISQIDTGSEKLSGCYCINKSCGSNIVFSNISHVLSDLGGAIVASVQAAEPSLTITSLKTEDTVIRYYGQKTRDAGVAIINESPMYTSGTFSPEQINKNNIDANAQAEKNRQLYDANSMYTDIVNGTISYVENPVSQEDCVIRRNIVFSQSNNSPIVTYEENCSGIDLTRCSINAEYICESSGSGCVNTIRNGGLTGFSPLPQYNTLIDRENKSRQFIADGKTIYEDENIVTSGSNLWWLIKKEFICKEDPNSYNFQEEYNGISQLKSEFNESGRIIITDENGNKSFETIEFQRIQGSSSACELGCKVTIPEENLQTTTQSATWKLNKNTSGLKTIYKSCIAGKCPVEEGETLIENCQCLNDFTSTVSVMESLNNASKDMVCSKK